MDVWRLAHIDDAATLSSWATHFRNQYCPDSLLDSLAEGTGKTKAEYLKDFKFPSQSGQGPSIRSGDFSEILVADFIEFIEGYWCPRERNLLKWNVNESTKGSDVIGFKLSGTSHPSDEMYVLESKADLSGSTRNRLQDAVDDSGKDGSRHALTLNAIKQRFLERGNLIDAKKIQRFQLGPGAPFVFRSGAVLISSDEHFDPNKIKATICEKHPNKDRLTLFVVTGAALMDLVHALYERAANEA